MKKVESKDSVLDLWQTFFIFVLYKHILTSFLGQIFKSLAFYFEECVN